MNIETSLSYLGGLSATQFMQQHWQRQPLWVVGGFTPAGGKNAFFPPLSRHQLLALAQDPSIESRLIRSPTSADNQWVLHHGPIKRLPVTNASPWTLLIQGVNHVNDATDALLDCFRFIPEARLDDVMVSIANRGGGVGAHYDSYDVFLIQAVGTRRWRISPQKDLALVPEAPLKLLADFRPAQEFHATAGDILYLPPHIAHEGVATSDDCMTISIGFRRPAAADLQLAYGEYILERLAQPDMLKGAPYADPGLSATINAALVPAPITQYMHKTASELTRQFAQLAQQSRCFEDFLGYWLTEPKPQLYFEASGDVLCLETLNADQGAYRLRLDARTRCVRFKATLYINGERVDQLAKASLIALVDTREIYVRRHMSGQLQWCASQSFLASVHSSGSQTARFATNASSKLANPRQCAPRGDWRRVALQDAETLQSWLGDAWLKHTCFIGAT